MPTYEYECRRCGHIFEEFKSITAPPRCRCPKCRGKVERLIGTGCSILFKGSGFYVNDSRQAGSDHARQAEKKGSDPDSKAKPAKAESKPKPQTTPRPS